MISNAVLLQLNRGSRTFAGDKHVPIRNSKTVYYRGRITCFIGRRYLFVLNVKFIDDALVFMACVVPIYPIFWKLLVKFYEYLFSSLIGRNQPPIIRMNQIGLFIAFILAFVIQIRSLYEVIFH